MVAGVLLGIGFGGFVDGIVLHQILQWHHMLTSTGDHPATTVAGLETNTVWDGLFHVAAWLAAFAGVWLLAGAMRDGERVTTPLLLGLDPRRLGQLQPRRGHRSTTTSSASTTSAPATRSGPTTPVSCSSARCCSWAGSRSRAAPGSARYAE